MKNHTHMKKIVKLSGQDVKAMVEKIITESKEKKNDAIWTRKPIAETKTEKKPGRIIRLNEAEMIEFLDRLATKIENGRRRRNIK